MEYRFRMDSIHAELELLAKEFDKALPPNKNDEAAFLLWFMENYPNAELQRALPIVKENFLDEGMENPVRRKCAKMLGLIGAKHMDPKTTQNILRLLLGGMRDNNRQMVCDCINSIEMMAKARRWQDFDHMIIPLLERIVDCTSPNAEPNILDAALSALAAIRPNEPEFLEDINEVKAELGRKRNRKDQANAWDSKVRRLEEIRQGWATLLIQRGKWEEKKAGIPAPKAKPQPVQHGAGTARGGPGRKRRIVTP